MSKENIEKINIITTNLVMSTDREALITYTGVEEGMVEGLDVTGVSPITNNNDHLIPAIPRPGGFIPAQPPSFTPAQPWRSGADYSSPVTEHGSWICKILPKYLKVNRKPLMTFYFVGNPECNRQLLMAEVGKVLSDYLGNTWGIDVAIPSATLEVRYTLHRQIQDDGAEDVNFDPMPEWLKK